MQNKRLKKIYKKYWHWGIIFPVVVLFFIATGSFSYYTQEYAGSEPNVGLNKTDFVKWASPDETANYIFAKLYGQTGEISIYEGYNLYTSDIMRPRSFRSDHGELKPVSFLGIILIFGNIVKLAGYKVLPFLTPLFGALGIIFYYLLIKRIFGRTNALLSAVLLAVFPVFTYYAARSMFHNILFISLLIAALYFSVLMASNGNKRVKGIKNAFIELAEKFRFKKIIRFKIRARHFLFSALAGIFFGLAIMTRTSELVWIAPLLIILWLFNIRRIGLLKLLIFLIFLFSSLLPMFYHNQVLYGSPILGGYAEMNQSIVAIKDDSAAILSSTVDGRFTEIKTRARDIFNTIFYFGLNPKLSLFTANAYIRGMFPWLFYASLFGAVIFLLTFKKRKYKQWIFLGAWLIVSVILIFYYGSWHFFDNPDKAAITIGNSYTRYWLPIYLGLIPLACIFIIRLTQAICLLFRKTRDKDGQLKMEFTSARMNQGACRFAVRLLMIGVIAISSITFVLSGSDEGLIYLAQRQKDSRAEWQKILTLTESNSTIITRYHDKLLFPERKVIVGLFDDKEMLKEYANLLDKLPVYYYNFTLPKNDMEYLNTRRLKEAGMQIQKVEKITSDFTLYKILENVK